MDKFTPKIYYENYKDYCIKLNESINSKDEKNIAVSGIFGSGKSSLIQTFEKAFNNKKGIKIVKDYEYSKKLNKANNAEGNAEDLKDCDVLNKKLDKLKEYPVKKALHISLANFNITNDKQLEANKSNKNSNDNKEQEKQEEKVLDEKDKIKKSISELDKYKEERQSITKMDESEIEKNLLQQFLFNVNSKKLPDSKVKRVDEKHNVKIGTYFISILFLIFVAIFIVNKFNFIWLSNTIIDKIFLSLCIISFILLCSFIILLIKPKSLKIDKVEICMAGNDFAQDSILSKFSDELLYFFKRTNYEIVYFEDLDRLPNLKIFNKLRELNYLLNNTETIKNKITFVYCISDSIISDYEERTKFFDNIITLQPFLTQEKVKKELHNIITTDMNNSNVAEFSHDMSRYITESRLFNAIKLDYGEKIKKTTNSEITNQIKVMALSIYKNLYYYDYNKLNTKTACLCKCFNLIELLKKEQRNKKQEEIDKIIKEINDSDSDENANVNIIKERVAGIIYLDMSSRIYVKSYQVQNSVNLQSISSFDQLKNSEGFYFDNSYSITRNKLNEYFMANYQISFDNYLLNTEVKLENIRNNKLAQIKNLRAEIKNVNDLSISDFMKKFDVDLTDNKEQFINICFKKGYIDSDYAKLVFGEDNLYLEEQDDAFIRYNNYSEAGSLVRDNYEYKVTNLIEISKRIFEDKFSNKAILNNFLIEHMLFESEEKNKKDKLIQFLNSDDKDVCNYFMAYIKSKDYEKVICLIDKLGNPYTIISAFSSVSEEIEEEKRNHLINYFINKFNLSNLRDTNKDKLLNILNTNNKWNDVNIDLKTINNLNYLNDVKIENISTFDEKSLNVIKNSKFFTINYDNILSISKSLYKVNNNSLILQSILDINDNSDDVEYKLFILQNISTFLNLFKGQIVDESSIKSLLNCENINIEEKSRVVTEVEFCISEPNGIDKDLLEQIVNCDKLKYEFKTIFNFYTILGKEIVKKYFNKENSVKIIFNIEDIEPNEQLNDFIKFIKNEFYLTDNAVQLFKNIEITELDILSVLDKNCDVNMLNLAKENFILVNENNLNNLIYCYKTYLFIIENNKQQFFEMLQNGLLALNDDLFTYILCETNDDEIRNLILNDYTAHINFDFENDLGISKEPYYFKIINIILNSEISTKNVLNKLFEYISTDNDLNLQYLQLVKKYKSFFDNKNEILVLFEKVDSQFHNCRIEGYQFELGNNKIIDEGLKLLKEMQIVKYRNNPKRIKIQSFMG